jgi:hypothetical protein
MKPALPVASPVNPNIQLPHAQAVSALTAKAVPQHAQAGIISPYPVYHAPQAYPIQSLTPYLGQYTYMYANGNLQLNLSLVEQIAACREAAVPALYGFLSQSQNILAICEALYTAQRLCETGVQGVGQLYGATQETFGPLLTMLMRNALQPGPPVPGTFNPQEEVGGAILDLIANKAAEKIKNQK